MARSAHILDLGFIVDEMVQFTFGEAAWSLDHNYPPSPGNGMIDWQESTSAKIVVMPIDPIVHVVQKTSPARLINKQLTFFGQPFIY